MAREADIPDSIVAGLPGFGRPSAEGDAAYVAPGSEATHEWGVQYQGSFEGEMDGTARAVRLHARALAAAGIPVMLQSFTGKFRGRDGSIQSASATSERVKEEVAHLRHPSIRSLRVRIKHAVIQHAGFLRSAIIPRSVMLERDAGLAQEQMRALYATTIVYSVWERSVIDPNIIGLLRRVAECWVPSEHNAKLLRDHGVERVTVVPHPWEASSALADGNKREPISGKRFYAIGIWQPRKGFHELLGAFLTAFTPTDNAWLTIKYQEYNWPGYPTPKQSIEHWLTSSRVQANGWKPELLGSRVSLLDKYLSEEALHALHLDNNIYVSPSHGEAFCFRRGTVVDTCNGPVVIECIKPGAIVYTHRGGTEIVTQVLKRRFHGRLVSIRAKGCSEPLVSTPDHRHLIVPRGAATRFAEVKLDPRWVEARLVEAGDFWVVPKKRRWQNYVGLQICDHVRGVRAIDGEIVCKRSFPPSEQQSLTEIARQCGCSFQFVSKVLNGHATQSVLAKRVQAYCRQNGIRRREPTRLRSQVEFTRDFMFLVGYYLAEGCTVKSAVVLTTNVDDGPAHEIAERAVKRAFGLKVTKREQGRKAVLWFSNSVLARLFRELCGDGALTKKIHPIFLNGQHSEELLRGLFWGDGSASGSRFRYSTSSPVLAAGIIDLLNRLGIFAGLQVSSRANGGAPKHEVRVAAQHAERFWRIVRPWKYSKRCECPDNPGQPMFMEDQNSFYVPIRNVELLPKRDQNLYNLSVKGDESFLVRGYATHNCLPAFDAKIAGNRLIHVPWGGTADFDDEDDYRLPFQMEPVPVSYRWDTDAEWASLEFDELVWALSRAAAPWPFARNARVEACSVERVGALMKERVEAVIQRAKEQG